MNLTDYVDEILERIRHRIEVSKDNYERNKLRADQFADQRTIFGSIRNKAEYDTTMNECFYEDGFMYACRNTMYDVESIRMWAVSCQAEYDRMKKKYEDMALRIKDLEG